MGHDVGGHSDVAKDLKIPDYRVYKVSKENTPKLWQYQERMAREGLKDPWIRNFVWRFEKPPSLWIRFNSVFYGAVVGLIGLGALVYIDKTRHCQWHAPLTEPYPLLYQMPPEEREQRLNRPIQK